MMGSGIQYEQWTTVTEMRQLAFDARTNAEKATSMKERQFWGRLAEKCDQAAADEESLRRDSLN